MSKAAALVDAVAVSAGIRAIDDCLFSQDAQTDAPSICSDTIDGMGSTVTCANYSRVLQSYGDVAGVVNVTYDVLRVDDARSLNLWGAGYNDLYGVLWADGGDSNSQARITLTPQGGDAVTLSHFDLGAYPNTTRGTTVAVYEIGNPTALFSYSGDVGSGPAAHTSFDMSVSSALGLQIVWQDSAYNVGIDNVSFQVGVVPQPSTVALMVAGLAFCGFAARRRSN